jgi:cysteine synthase A
VVSEQTDVAVVTTAYVAEQMGLPGIGTEAAEAATDKFLMRERCRVAGVPIPRYELVETVEQATAAASSIGLPVVIKPVDGQASRGVARVWDAADLSFWFRKSKERSRSGRLLVEEMLEGQDASVEGFVANGELRTLAISDKLKLPPRRTVDLRLVYPARYPAAVLTELDRVNRQVVAAVGIRLGFTHAEYVVTARGVRLLEVAARGCGAGVATELLPAMLGEDLIGLRIRQALGEPVTVPRASTGRCGLLEFLLLPPGCVEAVKGLAEARRLPGVVGADYRVAPGQIVHPPESGDERPGYLHAVADTYDELFQIADRVKRTVRVTVAPILTPAGW